MKGLLSRNPSKEDVESDQPLLREQISPEEDATCRTKTWRLPSVQQVFNATALIYILLSIPAILAPFNRQLTPTFSPARSRLTYEHQPLHETHEALEHKGFVGNPQDTEPYWRKLLEPMNFKATEDELHQANIQITDDVVRVSGGGYVGVLSVYHELHCLEALRKSTLRSYYYPNMTNDHDERTIEHLSHCIEYIRRTVMCHADVSVYTAVWIDDSHEVPNKDLVSGGERVCVNWDTVDTWSRERALVKLEYKVKPGPYEKILHPN